MESNQLRWGILGPGKICHQFAKGLRDSQSGVLTAVGSRALERAKAFVKEEGEGRPHGSYEELLADPEVEAVYVATPHPMHVEWAIKAAEAGKHILCEKPVGVNLGEADAIFEAGEVNGVFVMEAFMYRCYPQTAMLYEWVREGKVGEVQLIDASFGFRTNFRPESRLFADALAGGGILDVGCYPISAARMIAGAVEGEPFLNPVEVCGSAHAEETGVDGAAVASLKFPNGILAQCSTGVRMRGHNEIRVTGTERILVVESPWFGKGGMKILDFSGKVIEEVGPQATGYQFEIDTFARQVSLRTGRDFGMEEASVATWMRPEDSLGNIKTLDAWRKAVDLVYSFEKGKRGGVPPVNGRRLRMGKGPIQRREVEGFSKLMSSLAMGIDNQPDLPFLRTMVDDFVSKGGNVLDTAHIYGGGALEKMLGDYLKSRPSLRKHLFIIAKGAHLPYCYPDVIGAQLGVSLDRMGLETVELYLMHRDNVQVPVGEFVDALHEEQKKGRIQRYGVSNWTLERIRAFNRVAKRKGVDPIYAVSNNLSLAEMIDPIWPDCESAKDAGMAAWLKKTQTLLLPWSSQARGFFTDRSGPKKRDDAELVRCWYSKGNFERKKRAEVLANHYGVLPINIALAWLYTRPYPVCPLVGPRRLSELRTSLPGLEVSLTKAEAAWLDLETDERPI